MEEQGPADSPLRLDAPREEALARAFKLIEQAWRSFDRFRPEEPPLDERVRALLRSDLPEEPSPVFEVLDDVARILDESIAQPRPRYFAFIGSSGLEIGAIGDALASCYDINLAVHAGAATEIEKQAVRWVAEFVGYPATAGGAFTSGGTISNMTALAAARERALPGSRTDGMAGRRGAVYCSREVHYSITRAVELLGIGASEHPGPPHRRRAQAPARRGGRGHRPRPGRRRDARSGGGHRRDHADRRGRSHRCAGRRVRGAGRVAAPRRRVRPPRRGHGLGRPPVRRAGAGRLVLGGRAQVAVPAEGLRRRAGPPAGRPGAPPSRTRRGTCRTSATSCTPWTSRSSTRGRSGP